MHAAPSLASWSAPVTVAPLADAGNILPLVVAGAPGKLGFAWLHGDASNRWRANVALTLDGLAAAPAISSWQVTTTVAYTGTAASLMGACGTGPLAGIENGFTCGRSPDVFGITTDTTGRVVVTWPGTGGTYVTAQTAGDSLA